MSNGLPTPDMREAAARWYGGVPATWDVRKFKYVGRIRNGQVNPSLPKYRDLVLYAPNHIESGTGRLLARETGDEQGAESGKCLVDRGDILYSKIRPALRKVAMAPEDGLCSADMYPIKPANGIDSRFLFWILLSEGFARYSLLESDRVAMPKVNRDALGDCPLPVPDQELQRAAAAFLDRKTAAIDELIQKKERLIELLQEKRQALITQAVTKGLDPNLPMKDSGMAWLGRIPAHWHVMRVKHVAKLESGHTPDRSNPDYWRDDNDIPWVSLNDTRQLAQADYISDTALHVNALGIANSSARLLPARVVVFTRDATIGEAAITTRPMAVSQHVIAWVCGSGMLPEYLLRVFYVMKPELDRYTFGATLRTIGMSDVKTLVTTVPPVPEQRQIVAFLESEVGTCDATLRKVGRQIELLREYRMTLISAAVTGQIDVGNEAA